MPLPPSVTKTILSVNGPLLLLAAGNPSDHRVMVCAAGRRDHGWSMTLIARRSSIAR
jgi:hypothetical protein